MRSREPTTSISDALAAGEWLVARLAHVTLEQFAADETLCAAVERKLEIVGEALSRAARADAALEEAIPDLHRIIGLRNVLAHGYDVVDAHAIYLIATAKVPDLIEALRTFPGVKEAE